MARLHLSFSSLKNHQKPSPNTKSISKTSLFLQLYHLNPIMNMFTDSLSTPGVTLSAITSVVAPLSTSLSAVVEVVVSKSLLLYIVLTFACVAMFLLWKMLLLCSLSFDFVTRLITNPSYRFISRSRSQSSMLSSTPSDSPEKLGFVFS